jgi:hypothetical protein
MYREMVVAYLKYYPDTHPEGLKKPTEKIQSGNL